MGSREPSRTRAHRITDEVVKPHFRKADYAGGIEAGVNAILAAARGEPYRGNGRTAAESKGPWKWLASLPNDPNMLLGILFLALLLPAVLVLALWKRSRPGPPAASSSAGGSPAFSSESPSWSSSDTSSSDTSDSSSSSSSSSSDFSGGGGDSGGGGSSDSW